jgi:branched-chain amino acid transport system ATP-binding protein
MSRPTTSDTQLVVSNVEAVYHHSISALRGVNFSLRRGEIVALLGANGAGKSTTLKAVSNLLPADRGRISRGSIHFEGRDIVRTPTSTLVRLGLVQVLEGRHCFKSLTVEENLISGGLGRGASRAEISADLEKVYGLFPRLKEKRRTPAGLTSGGEQQMTAIGRALLSRPKLLVLDEPSMGLAPLLVRDIFRTLQALNQEEGLSILVAEQNSSVALQFAHHVVILENGVTVLEETAAELGLRGDLQSYYLGARGLSPVAAA